jgi:hypothetical protein
MFVVTNAVMYLILVLVLVLVLVLLVVVILKSPCIRNSRTKDEDDYENTSTCLRKGNQSGPARMAGTWSWIRCKPCIRPVVRYNNE